MGDQHHLCSKCLTIHHVLINCNGRMGTVKRSELATLRSERDALAAALEKIGEKAIQIRSKCHYIAGSAERVRAKAESILVDAGSILNTAQQALERVQQIKAHKNTPSDGRLQNPSDPNNQFTQQGTTQP